MRPILPTTEPDLWPHLVKGAQAFDDRRFWWAHEAWEDGWRLFQDPDRDYVKGLIQVAAAAYHLQRQRRSAAIAVLDRVPRHLALGDPRRWPFEAGHLLCICSALRAGCTKPQMPGPPGLRLLPMLLAWEHDHA